MLDGKYKMLI